MTGQTKFERIDFDDIKLNEPKWKFYFATVNGADWVTVQWGGYDYDIQMSRIPDPMALLQWVAHLGQKKWPDMTPWEISAFIEKVCRRKGWA